MNLAEDLDMSLVCPLCRSKLILSDKEVFSCSQCLRSWKINKDIPYFIDTDFYWAEPGFSKGILQKINKAIENKNWRDVIRYHDSEDVRKNYTFLTAPKRIIWADLVSISKDSIILDLGAGMGTISQAMSLRYKTVYAVEPVEERVEFMRIRFSQDGVKNIKIIRTDIDNLPFPERSFDLIILNGMLEWLPFTRRNIEPRRAQIYYLKLLRKLLKDGGYLYIGVENRFHYTYFRGTKDPHIGIKYVTILPRALSHFICKYKTGDIYRPYIYSAGGYKHLLTDAGFKNIQIYGIYPSYNEPQHLINIENNSIEFKDLILTSNKRPAQIIKKILLRTNTLKYFGYAYSIFARNN